MSFLLLYMYTESRKIPDDVEISHATFLREKVNEATNSVIMNIILLLHSSINK